MRVQDAFEFCLTSDVHRRSRSGSDGLVWGSGYHLRKRSAKGKERSSTSDDTLEGRTKRGGFEGIEKVLAAIGFGGAGVPSSPSGARRGALTRDLFDTPEPEVDEDLMLGMVSVDAAGPSSSTNKAEMLLPLKTPKMAKRNSKDKDDISLVPLPLVPSAQSLQNTAAPVPGAPLLSLPYPFTQNGVGRVSSRDLVPFPAVGGVAVAAAGSVGRQSRGSRSTGSRGSRSGTTGSGSGTGTGEEEEEEEEDDDDEDEDEEDEDDEEEEEEDEDPSSNIGSESMSSLGQPISPSRGHPFFPGTNASPRARPHAHGHTRNPSGVSSGLSMSRSSGTGPRTQGRRSISSGATGATGTGSFSGGAYSNRYSYSASSGGAVMSQESGRVGSVGSRSTGNRSTTSEEDEGRERSLSVEGERGAAAAGIPMPPRHPNLQGTSHVLGQGQVQGQTRTRKVAISTPSSSSSSRSGSVPRSAGRLSVPVSVPGVVHRASPVVFPFPSATAGGIGTDVEGRYEDRRGGFEGYEWAAGEGAGEEGEDEDERGEREDRLGLLVPSPRVSMVSVVGGTGNGGSGGNGTQGGGGRSRTHSFHSIISSSSSSRSRSRTHSSHSISNLGSPSVRERASSVGHSVRSIVVAAAAGLGGSRSRVNSSMARLEEEREDSAAAVGEFGEKREKGGPAEQEGYASTASHSRSGSESVSGENYTFGRPVAFMRAGKEREERVDEEVEGEGDVVLMERAGSRVPDATGDDDEINEEDAGEEQGGHHEREGIDIPGRARAFQTHLHPQHLGVDQPTTVSDDGSHADISTAPASFVTAPPSMSHEGVVAGSAEEDMMGVGVGGQLGPPGSWRIV
jgi:hypothetical protein